MFRKLAKRASEPTAKDRRVFGVPLTVSIQYAGTELTLKPGKPAVVVPIIVAKCGSYLKEKGLHCDGIFRSSGSARRIADLQGIFDSSEKLYGQDLDWSSYTPNDAADILRRYLTHLPEPVIPLDFYDRFRQLFSQEDADETSQAVGSGRQGDLLIAYRRLIGDLPQVNQDLLLYLLDLIALFAAHSEETRMTSTSLALVFQPEILARPGNELEIREHALSQDVLEYLIGRADELISRKIKCDKSIPCQPCVARAEARECRRETVKVRGHVRTGGLHDSVPTYEDVLQENVRLRALLAGQAHRDYAPTPVGHTESSIVSPRPEEAEHRLFGQIALSSVPRKVCTDEDIVMPSRDFSNAIVKHSFQWTFWVHYALFIPEFEREHEGFWDQFAATGSLDGADRFWLATYFSVLASNLLFMDEEEIAQARPQGISFTDLVRNWYEAALLCLDMADYMEKLNVNTIRSIAILGIVFNNVGDVNRHRTLWAVAIQQAQQLKMGIDSAHEHETYIQQQTRRRLWWTLVICDWLPVPHRIPCVNDVDFDCRVPDEIDDDELASCTGPSRLPKSKPRPMRYHITMIQIARIHYQVRYKLHLRKWNAAQVAEFVFAADEQLANLISELPAYLQFDEVPTDATRERDLQNPFIPWQKESLSMVLLYYRMAIGRLLQEHWLDGSITGARTRAICMSSAQGLINCTHSQLTDVSKMRPWALSMNVFSACATLALESSATGQDFSDEIQHGLDYLRRIQSQNMFAEHCIRVLQELLHDTYE